MSSWQTRIRTDGSRTPDFRRIDIDHKIGCPLGDELNQDGWFWHSPKCTCGKRWFLEQEIKAHEKRMVEEQQAVDILKELLNDIE